MGTPIGTLYASVRADDKKLKGDLKGAEEKVHGAATRMQKALVGALSFGAAIYGINRLVSAGAEWARMAGVQQKAVAGMDQAMKSMGRYSPELSKRLTENAQALQKITTFGDEATIEGTKFLLTYKDIGDNVLPQAQKTMLDLAQLMGGDTKQAANMLGKASMGLSGELRRVGITIDEDIAKGGDFEAILREINNQVGGQAERAAQTGIGAWEQLGNVWGDTQETLGELALAIGEDLVPALTEMANEIARVAKEMTKVVEGKRGFLDFVFGMTEYREQQEALKKEIQARVFGRGEAGTGGADIAGLAAAEAMMRESAAAGISGAGKAGGDMTEEDADRLPLATGWQGSADMYLTESDIEQMNEQMEREREMLEEQEAFKRDARWNTIMLEKEWAEQSLSEYIQRANAEIEAEKKKEAAKRVLDQQAIDRSITGLRMLGQHSEIAFRIWQASAAAETVVKGAQAAQVAWLQGMEAGGPWGGPALAAAYAAAAVLFTAGQLATIASASPSGGGGGGGGGGGSMPSVGTYSASPSTGLPSDPGAEEGRGKQYNLTLVYNGGKSTTSLTNVDDEEFADLVNNLNNFVENRGGRLVSSETRE